MGFFTVLSRDPLLAAAVSSARAVSAGATVRSPGRLLWLVKERPVTTVVMDSGAFGDPWESEATLRELGRRFPSVGVVFVARRSVSPLTLLQLGRADLPSLRVLRYEELGRGLARSLAHATEGGTRARTLRLIGQGLGSWERRVVGEALEAAVLGGSADDFAHGLGWTRAHLGSRLRLASLPSPGRLLLWAKMLHAARWISESGRTAESVSRQLDYANGATFRRALRGLLRCTPTQLIEGGGYGLASRRFLDVCGLGDRLVGNRSVA